MYLKYRLQEEDRVPGIRSIEEVNDKFQRMGLFFRDYESEYHAKHLGPYTMFNNEDLEDCIRPYSAGELDPSIINLRGDPHKHIFVSRKMKDEVVVSLDRR